MTIYTSMEAHADFPHLPAKCGTKPDPACGSCPLLGSAGHKTAAEFYPREAATEQEKLNGYWLARLQHAVWRRNFDGEGIKAAAGDSWYPYNGRDTINYVYFQSYNVTAVDGNQVTRQADGVDPRQLTRNTYRAVSPDDGTGLVKIDYFTSGCIQPLAAVKFSANSKLTNIWAVVYRIVATDIGASTITLECDKSVAAALDKIDPEGADITASVYQYGSPENWQFVIRPDYFYGARKQGTIQAADVPADGLYTLESDAAVMHPNGFDPLTPTWVLEGWKADPGAWETAAQQDQRLFVAPDGPSVVALKTTKPTGAVASLTLSDDLTATYTKFRVTYYKYTDGTGQGCTPVGYARCRYSMPDYSNSVGTGYTGNGCGTGMYCSKRLQDHSELSDEHGANPGDPPDGIRDTNTQSLVSASGVANYPAHGRCLQYGMCDSFQGAEAVYDRQAPFQFARHVGVATRDLVAAMNHRRYQPQPGVDAWQLERILHPSLCQLAGYILPATYTGIHPQAEFSGNGTWPLWEVQTDVDGNESIVALPGPYEQADGSDGLFPTRVTGFKTVRDKLTAGATQEQQYLDLITAGIERDTGSTVGSGLDHGSYAVAAQDLIIAPNVDITVTDTVQTCANGSFKRYSDSTTPAEVRVIPLRQDDKAEEDYGSRTVHAVSGTGTVTIELDNETHSWSVPKPLFSEDDISTWKAGGAWPICPPAGAEIINYYEDNKNTGSRGRGARRGDGIRTADGRVLLITSVTPFGGSEAADWDGTTPTDNYSADLAYLSHNPKKRDIVTVLDDAHGTAAALTDGDTITFVRSAAVMKPGALLEWTEFGTDAWAEVAGATCWYGQGLWEVPDTWFTDKPTKVCFRAAGIEWMDHRGMFPGTLANKLQGMVDALDTWVGYPTGAVLVDPITISAGAVQTALDDGSFTDPYYSEEPYPGSNNIGGGWTPPPRPPYCSCEGSAALHLGGQAFGLPGIMTRTNATVVQAWAEVSCTELTKTVTTWQLVPNDPGPGYYWESTSTVSNEVSGFAVLGASGTADAPGWGVIGNIGGGAEGTRVIDVTGLVTAMVSSGCHSFMIVPADLAFAVGGSLEDLVTGMLEPKPTRAGPVDVDGNGIITTGAGDGENETNVIDSGSSWNITFGSISVGRMAVKLAYPEAEKQRMLLMPMWPDMSDTV